ncbi:MAG: SGNH/GDSL hydrolase family protein [Gammaproteobacteria bacterium]|nr:SGNH/GDSL hydrolase family protein [Gammaproteobacteria bacterium]
MNRLFPVSFLFLTLLLSAPVRAELPWQFDTHTRYMALGDSLVAGYGAVPATQGYVYLLYQGGVFDQVPNTLFSNAGVPGATSKHVRDHQVPQAIEAFRPTVVTLTVGGNDLLRILNGADPAQVLAEFQTNFAIILQSLKTSLPQTRIYVSNLYTVSDIPGADQVVPYFNQIVAGVAGAYGVPVADVYTAFQGRKGLLLIDRNGAGQYEVHPTNAGYRAMAQAFESVIK